MVVVGWLGSFGGDGVGSVGKYAVLESSTSLLKVSEIRNVAKDICSPPGLGKCSCRYYREDTAY